MGETKNGRAIRAMRCRVKEHRHNAWVMAMERRVRALGARLEREGWIRLQEISPSERRGRRWYALEIAQFPLLQARTCNESTGWEVWGRAWVVDLMDDLPSDAWDVSGRAYDFLEMWRLHNQDPITQAWPYYDLSDLQDV